MTTLNPLSLFSLIHENHRVFFFYFHLVEIKKISVTKTLNSGYDTPLVSLFDGQYLYTSSLDNFLHKEENGIHYLFIAKDKLEIT